MRRLMNKTKSRAGRGGKEGRTVLSFVTSLGGGKPNPQRRAHSYGGLTVKEVLLLPTDQTVEVRVDEEHYDEMTALGLTICWHDLEL